jgi:hypothetical protein
MFIKIYMYTLISIQFLQIRSKKSPKKLFPGQKSFGVWYWNETKKYNYRYIGYNINWKHVQSYFKSYGVSFL